MRNICFVLFISALLIVYSCKSSLITGSYNQAIEYAVLDFVRSDARMKNDSIFFIYTDDIDDETLGICFMGAPNKVLVSTEDEATYSSEGLPTKYLEERERLFYWYDSTTVLTNETISAFSRFDHIDTMIVGMYIPEGVIDDSKRQTHYYFCKNDLSRFKKVRTKKALGYYDPPTLRCE